MSATIGSTAVDRRETGERHEDGSGNLLCVVNFPANTGYAWTFIEELYAGIATDLATRGIVTWVAYPEIDAEPETLRGSVARAVELDFDLRSVEGIRTVVQFVRKRDISVLYLADRASWDPAYAALRAAGVRRIVVHDHTSGERTVPRGWRRIAKQVRNSMPGALADRVLAVSDFVARRKVQVDLLSPGRVHRVWNSVHVERPNPDARERLRDVLDLEADRVVIGCAARATPEKGIPHLLHAFDRFVRSLVDGAARPALVYFGDGPAMERLRTLRSRLATRDSILFAGYRGDAAVLLEGADVCVVPSTWAEAFGLSALEPMARGVPVIASRVGGLPEIVVEGETGLLVPPEDEVALEAAIRRLIADPAERRRMGEAGRRRAGVHFSRDAQLRTLVSLLFDGSAHATA